MRAEWTGRRSVIAAIAAGVLLGSAGGCGSGVDPAAEADRAASAATTHGGPTGAEIILPINAYGYNVRERDDLSRARDILTGQCMRRFGFAYDDAADAAEHSQLTSGDSQNFGLYGNKRRYSVTDMATATKYGYHLVSTTAAPAKPRQPANSQGLGALSAAGEAILVGFTTDGRRVTRSASGRSIPPHGCVGAADAALSGTGSVGEAQPVRDLAQQSYEQSLKNAAVTKAFQAWRTCMSGKGHHLGSPLDNPGFDIDTRTVSMREVTTARDDVSCKQQAYLVDIWFHAEVTYQKQRIQRHADQFRRTRSEHDAMIEKVNQIISAAH